MNLDRTFCAAACANAECDRNLTGEIAQAAERNSRPLSMADLREGCAGYVMPSELERAE